MPIYENRQGLLLVCCLFCQEKKLPHWLFKSLVCLLAHRTYKSPKINNIYYQSLYDCKKEVISLVPFVKSSLSVVGRQGALKQFLNLYINNLWGVELACIEQITYYLLMTLWKTYFNQCIYIIIQKIYFTFYFFLKKLSFYNKTTNHVL